ncbi:hypothetical protein Acr_05g0007680 [Actinidia rufa]|uniref:Putative plant transposon protein domain-containing protein n=1 Tax=Actinidia rufa TaxID=165716 RepID=A0A7J0EMB8_9ERIC|nr:hypothetical protein Acr_05g0007680 [Actinidia rufa]
MSTPQKRKGPQTLSSYCSSGTTSKRQATGFRSQSGTSSGQRGDASIPDASKFRPNSNAEAHFNHSFKYRLMFIFYSVILEEFSETLIYTYFTKWGWQRLAVYEGVVCLELVREFFTNIHASNKESGTLKSYVRGVYLDFSISDICAFHHIQPLDPNIIRFPYSPSTNGPSLNSLAHLLLADEGDWPPSPSSLLKQKGLKDVFRVLNHIIYDMFQCMSYASEIDETRVYFMHAIALDLSVDVSRLMFNLILKASLDNSSHAYLPLWLLITEFLARHPIVSKPDETHVPMGKAISRHTLRMSNAHLGVAPLPPQLRPHAMDLDPSDDEISPATPDVLSTSSTPPSAAHLAATSNSNIADAIAALFTHMNVIHTDLVERIE